MPDLNNPNHLLRVLAALDGFVVLTSVMIPSFRDESVIDFIASIPDMPLEYAVANSLWIALWLGWMASWICMLRGMTLGRHLYLFLLVLGLTIAYLTGIPRQPGGILAVMSNINGSYYGFVVCMLYFGPVSAVFIHHNNAAQQVDSAEPSTNAVPPSIPSGSAR